MIFTRVMETASFLVWVLVSLQLLEIDTTHGCLKIPLFTTPSVEKPQCPSGCLNEDGICNCCRDNKDEAIALLDPCAKMQCPYGCVNTICRDPKICGNNLEGVCQEKSCKQDPTICPEARWVPYRRSCGFCLQSKDQRCTQDPTICPDARWIPYESSCGFCHQRENLALENPPPVLKDMRWFTLGMAASSAMIKLLFENTAKP